MIIMMMTMIIIIIIITEACCSVCCYKPEGFGFETGGGNLMFTIYLILPAALRPRDYSASTTNRRKNVSGE
jgi:hypothetical protein